MLSLQGSPARSPFRIAKLLGQLRAREPAVTGLTSRFVHFVDVERALEPPESAVLQQLLTYGPRPDAAQSDAGAQQAKQFGNAERGESGRALQT